VSRLPRKVKKRWKKCEAAFAALRPHLIAAYGRMSDVKLESYSFTFLGSELVREPAPGGLLGEP
jgi:hypothetical protein